MSENSRADSKPDSMPDSRQGPAPASGPGRAARAPILIAAFLLGCVVYCAWLIFSAHDDSVKAAEAQAQKIEALKNEKAELEAILRLSPCDAQNRLLPKDPVSDSSSKESSQGENRTLQASQAAENAAQENIEKAVVFLAGMDAVKKAISTGSGFFVAPGYVLTNRHVVDNVADGKILVTSKSLGRAALGRVVAKSAKGGDYALVQVDMPGGAKTAILEISPDVRRADKVGAWGFPNLVGKSDPGYARLLSQMDISAVPELSYSEGVVSAVLERSPRLIVHTAPISPGNSGGPLVNAKGQAVGINTMISLDEGSYRQASIALTGADLLRFMKDHGVKAGAK